EHFFDGWKANPEYARQTIRAAVEGGAMIVVMCDTNGGSMPEEVAALTREAASAVDVPLGIHTHNDCDLAVANSLAAIDAGATHHQRPGRALRQCRPGLGRREPCAQEERLRSAWQLGHRAPDGAFALCVRNCQHAFSYESAVRRTECVCA